MSSLIGLVLAELPMYMLSIYANSGHQTLFSDFRMDLETRLGFGFATL